MIPIVKNKDGLHSCSNFRGTSWSVTHEATRYGKDQLKEDGFMPWKSTTYALFALRVLMEKYRQGLLQESASSPC